MPETPLQIRTAQLSRLGLPCNCCHSMQQVQPFKSVQETLELELQPLLWPKRHL